jgi:hypothetical protein
MATALNAACQANAALIAAGFSFAVATGVITIVPPPATLPAGAWTFSKTVGTTETITLAAVGAANITNISITGLYTGSLANAALVTIGPGTAAGSTKLVLGLPNMQPEVFDNLIGAGNVLWTAMANAVNNGMSAMRGPSKRFVATAGAGAAAGPVANTNVALTGGSDGASGVTTVTLVGQDVVPRKGLYALRSQGCATINPVDAHDNTQWTAMLAFGLQEGAFVGSATSPGDTIANAATELSTAGVDGYGVKVLFGDWIYWFDQVNGVTRLLSPASFWAGMRSATTPQNSTLNKPMLGIIGTQKSYTGTSYSNAELQALLSARLDVIANPCPGGSFFGIQGGINAASNPAVNGENYTMMTNFLAGSIASWAGSVVGQLQSPGQRRRAKATMDNFFANLWTAFKMIGNAQGTVPWQVVINDTTTPPDLAAQGYEIAAVKVQYLAVIRWFIVNLEGGQTVTINLSPSPPKFAAAA